MNLMAIHYRAWMMRNDKINVGLLSGLTRILLTSKRLTSRFYQKRESEQTHVVLISLIFPSKFRNLRSKSLLFIDGLKRNTSLFSYSGSPRYVSNPLDLLTGRGSFRKQCLMQGLHKTFSPYY